MSAWDHVQTDQWSATAILRRAEELLVRQRDDRWRFADNFKDELSLAYALVSVHSNGLDKKQRIILRQRLDNAILSAPEPNGKYPPIPPGKPTV
jgi:hypothetical protein